MPRRAGEVIVAEWNLLVPEARARGINVVPWTARNDTGRARRRLAWLRSMLNGTTVELVVAQSGDFVEVAFPDFTFGVEIECILPRRMSRTRIAQLITEAGVVCTESNYRHSGVPRNWIAKPDGSMRASLQPGESEAELVSPILRGQDGLRQAHVVCAILKAHGAKIRKSCGLHVHVGTTDLHATALARLMRLYSQHEAVIDQILAPSRRRNLNTYCRPIRIDEARLARAVTRTEVRQACGQHSSNDRYRKVNLMTEDTAEFRQHQGTSDPEKLVAWIRFCIQMVATAATDPAIAPQDTLAGFMAAIGLHSHDRVFYARRRDHFNRSEARAEQ